MNRKIEMQKKVGWKKKVEEAGAVGGRRGRRGKACEGEGNAYENWESSRPEGKKVMSQRGSKGKADNQEGTEGKRRVGRGGGQDSRRLQTLNPIQVMAAKGIAQ